MTNSSPSVPKFICNGPRSYLAIAVFIIVGALLALPLFIGSASAPTKSINRSAVLHKTENSTVAPQNVAFTNFNLFNPTPQAGPVTLDTYAGNCTTPKTVYNVRDTDLTVCAKFTNAVPGWKVIWSNARGTAVQSAAITSGNSSATFTLTQNSSLADWRVILFEPFGGTVQAVTTFTVIDEDNPSADVSVTKSVLGSASAGAQLLFAVQVTNAGPSAAAAVQVLDSVPANTTFVSFEQLAGPTFACVNPNVGEVGTTTCDITSLGRSETAIFLATYLVDEVGNGTVISDTASVTTTTSDPNDENDSASASATVKNAACVLSTPENITVSADTGQAGAVVTYTAPTGTGFCGTATTGENGENIPAISCNPPSGSFFPVGTTPVICVAQSGAAVSFQVTVDNPGALSISLQGGDSVTLECGQRFGDPGATAVDGSGQSIEVAVSYSGGFDPDAPAVGSYTGHLHCHRRCKLRFRKSHDHRRRY